MKIITQTIFDQKTGSLTEMSYPDFSLEIDRGASFLDRMNPGWRERINPQLLNVAHADQCVCGQVFTGHYDEGVALLLGDSSVGVDEADTYQRRLLATPLSAAHGFFLAFPEDIDIAAQEYEARDLDVPDELERLATESVELLNWARAYVTQNADPYDVDEVAVKAAYSTLTEQWLTYINQTRKVTVS